MLLQREPHKELLQICRPRIVPLTNFNMTFYPHYCMPFSDVSDLFLSKFTFRLNLDRHFGLAKSKYYLKYKYRRSFEIENYVYKWQN